MGIFTIFDIEDKIFTWSNKKNKELKKYIFCLLYKQVVQSKKFYFSVRKYNFSSHLLQVSFLKLQI